MIEPARYLGKTLLKWTTQLHDVSQSARQAAVDALALIAREATDPPLDRIECGLKARLKVKVEEPWIRSALIHCLVEVELRRGLSYGLRVPWPENLADLPDQALFGLVLERVWDAAMIYSDRETLERSFRLATPGQRAICAIAWTESEVMNGGLHQYFSNPTGILACDAADGFALIGASKVATVMRRAIAIFPNREWIEQPERRIDAMHHMSAEAASLMEDLTAAYYEASEAAGLDKLIAEYVRAHPSEFFWAVG